MGGDDIKDEANSIRVTFRSDYTRTFYKYFHIRIEDESSIRASKIDSKRESKTKEAGQVRGQ
jgi:hypothetical protein